jgi:hypothetical protein
MRAFAWGLGRRAWGILTEKYGTPPRKTEKCKI